MQMYRLVEDVERYPEFLSWCHDAEMLERGPAEQLARLDIQLAGFRHHFTTRNRLEPGERLTMSLVEGPFRRLGGEWRFQALGDEGCKITLDLAFDFASAMLSLAFRRSFTAVADRLVADFVQRATDVYGTPRP